VYAFTERHNYQLGAFSRSAWVSQWYAVHYSFATTSMRTTTLWSYNTAVHRRNSVGVHVHIMHAHLRGIPRTALVKFKALPMLAAT
jgi:hypothetical protein